MGTYSLEDGEHDLLDVDVDAGRQGEGDVFKGFEGCFEQRESIWRFDGVVHPEEYRVKKHVEIHGKTLGHLDQLVLVVLQFEPLERDERDNVEQAQNVALILLIQPGLVSLAVKHELGNKPRDHLLHSFMRVIHENLGANVLPELETCLADPFDGARVEVQEEVEGLGREDDVSLTNWDDLLANFDELQLEVWGYWRISYVFDQEIVEQLVQNMRGDWAEYANVFVYYHLQEGFEGKVKWSSF